MKRPDSPDLINQQPQAVTFKEYAKDFKIANQYSAHDCQMNHEEIRLQSMISKNYKQINSKPYQVHLHQVLDERGTNVKDKVLVKRKVINDFLSIGKTLFFIKKQKQKQNLSKKLQKRSQILSHIHDDCKLLNDVKNQNIYYLQKYYNDMSIQEIENLFALIGAEFNFGLSGFIRSAQKIRQKVLKAEQDIEIREQQVQKQNVEEKLRKREEKKILEQQKEEFSKNDAIKSTSDQRIQFMKGFLTFFLHFIINIFHRLYD